ncbi:hypothetical protein [Deinococcus soli (ex Cha et al. 2016)]|uniref:Uncharacterized protein n=1 Tax=Deinococcus soli (ex Cha et al. 2016) TaxID=1309411 RepID=A0A0F7JKU2_9DEIO|nr:hypothetical protein [Deinococcus soli (ex Cha et al. 2016)]AKH16182.1 hypothetical protein SY84_02945 [Deinococcus soli (ex Cha et al. 2016)]
MAASVPFLDSPATLKVGPGLLHPVAPVGPDHILTLMDAGPPDMLGTITDELAQGGYALGQVRREVRGA